MITLVTACMNREPHLRQTLPCWLELPRVEEIVVVDWSNRRPLSDLRAMDARIKVVRVEDEPKWVLSYAYNAGISHATQPVIFKCDADCMPTAEATNALPGPAHFFSGRALSAAAANKPSVNGQCIFSRAQFDAVNGYSELIRTYGRDDEDFYDRLIASGYARRDLCPDWLEFVDHTHAERTANQFAGVDRATIESKVRSDTLYNEMKNAFIALEMRWGASSQRASFYPVEAEDRLVVLLRDKTKELPIAAELERKAHLFALRALVQKLAQLPRVAADKLDERACFAVIESRLKARAGGFATPQAKVA